MTVTVGSSLPSTPVTVIDVPEVTNFVSEFVYNFFAPDELTNDQTTTTDPGNTINFSRTIPRYVRLKWDKVNASSDGKIKKEFIDLSLEQNASQIIDEDHLDLKFFQTFTQQENDLVTQTQSYLDRLYRQLGYNKTNASLSDVARAINESLPVPVSNDEQWDYIQRYLNYSHSENVRTANDTSLVNPTSEAEGIPTVLPMNNRSYGNIFHEKFINDSLVPLNRTLLQGVDSFFSIQNTVSKYTNNFNGSQYDLYLEDPINTEISEHVEDFGTVYQTTGYVIDRYRLLADGTQVEKKTFYVENPDTVEFFDTQVCYNQRYIYTIKAVLAIQTLSFNGDQRVNVVSTFLIASKLVRSVVTCEDKRPPAPPTDFFVRWDVGLKKPVLTWNFPNDTRRHIKYFQVFCRKNLKVGGFDVRPVQLPFELVRMYDFNDLKNGQGVFYTTNQNMLQFYTGEDSISLEVVMSPQSTKQTTVFTPTCYIDEDFNHEDYYVYAVAAVDAHGISSNYSNQIGVKFNKQRNTIERVDISSPGAPKPYPNMYLNKDAFVDTIKNEGYSQVTVVFNPEYHDLQRQSGEDLSLLSFGPDNFYRLQLINTDLQSDQFIDIKITDDRNRS